MQRPVTSGNAAPAATAPRASASTTGQPSPSRSKTRTRPTATRTGWCCAGPCTPIRRDKDGQLHREIAYFLVHAPVATTVSEIISRAGGRWQIEEDNEINKQFVGLAQYQVRKWTPWHRHITACMLATAFLTIQRAAIPEPDQTIDPEPDTHPKQDPEQKSSGHRRERGRRLIPGPLLRPSIHTIRHCLAATHLNPHHPVETILTCELWRRLHQTRAMVSHYRRRGDPLPDHLRPWAHHRPIPPITDPQDLRL
jgi:hypothetical protein